MLFSSPFCSILFPFMNHEPPPISSLSSHKFYHHWSMKSGSPIFFPTFSPFFLSLLSVLWFDTLNRFSSSQSRRFAVQSEPSSISSLPSHKFHHHWSIKSPSPVFFPPFFTLSSLFYDLIHRISLVHFRVVDSQFNLDIADSILVSPIL